MDLENGIHMVVSMMYDDPVFASLVEIRNGKVVRMDSFDPIYVLYYLGSRKKKPPMKVSRQKVNGMYDLAILITIRTTGATWERLKAREELFIKKHKQRFLTVIEQDRKKRK